MINKKFIYLIFFSLNCAFAQELNFYDQQLEKLKKNPSAIVSKQEGWIVIQIKNSKPGAIWSFAPYFHPAYPSFAKRTLVNKNGAWNVRTELSCGAEKTECDKLSQQFKLLDIQLRKSLEK